MSIFPRIVTATRHGVTERLVQWGGGPQGQDLEHLGLYYDSEGRELGGGPVEWHNITPVEEAWTDLPEVTRCERTPEGGAWLVESQGHKAVFVKAYTARWVAEDRLLDARRYMAAARAIEAAEAAEKENAEAERQELLDRANRALDAMIDSADEGPPGSAIRIARLAGARLTWPEDGA